MNLANPLVSYIELPRALSPASIASLNQQWLDIKMAETELIILKGSTEDFCMGMDINWVANDTSHAFTESMEMLISFLKNLQAAPCVTMAMVTGQVTGGGVGLCAACDIVLAAEDSSFCLTEGLLGLTPGIILSPLLSRLPKQVLAKMVFTAKKYSAQEALQIGLIDDFSKKEELEILVKSWISQLKRCKKQSVIDLKLLLATTDVLPKNLMAAGADLLKERLNDPIIRNRLLDLAYFNEA